MHEREISFDACRSRPPKKSECPCTGAVEARIQGTNRNNLHSFVFYSIKTMLVIVPYYSILNLYIIYYTLSILTLYLITNFIS